MGKRQVPLGCDICHKEFKRRDSLRSHMFVHKETDKSSGYICDLCNKPYAKLDRLKRHMLTHLEDGFVPHDVVVNTAGESQQNKDLGDNLRRFICEICGATYKDFTNLQNHQQKHNGMKLHTCLVCNKNYNNKTYLERHLRMHMGYKEFKCDVMYCGEAFYSKAELWRHKQRHTGKLKKPEFRCNLCYRQFYKLESVDKHYKEKHYDSAKEGGIKRGRLIQRERDETDLKLQYSCHEDKCGKQFRTLSALQCHLETKHVSQEPPFVCSGCAKTFEERKLLLFHRRTCHDDVKSRDFQCSHCGSCFYSKAMLQRHEKTIHMNYRPFKCETCSKTFQSRQNLQGHERSHTGEKPYKCDQCNYATALSSSLRTHKMRHTGEKPFKCDLCEFRCRIRPTLRTHMLIHTPRELVACKICGKKLKTKTILQVHMQKMHMREKINIVIYEGESDSLVDEM